LHDLVKVAVCSRERPHEEIAIEPGDTAPFFDFENMPGDWELPVAQPKAGFIA